MAEQELAASMRNSQISREKTLPITDDSKQKMAENDEHKRYIPATAEKLGFRFRIEQLSQINTVNTTYRVKGVAVIDWLATDDDRKMWQKEKENYSPSLPVPLQMFYPNCVESSVEMIKYRLFIGNDNKHYNVQMTYISGTFTNKFECSYFPFDVQSLVIICDPDIYIEDLVLVPSRYSQDIFYLNKTHLSLADWNIVHYDTCQTYIDWSYHRTGKKSLDVTKATSSYMDYWVFRIQIKRLSSAFVMRVMLWMFLLSSMTFAIFGFEAYDLEARLSFAIGLMVSYVAFQFIIGEELPNLPYFTIVDKYNLSMLIFVLAVSFESVVVGWKSSTLLEDYEQIDHIAGFVFFALFALYHLGFIMYIIKAIRFENEKIGSMIRSEAKVKLGFSLGTDLSLIPIETQYENE